jgi:hypothetical protein
MFVSQTRSWQKYCSQVGITNVNSQAGWHQYCLARLDFDRRIDTGTHVQAG